MSTIRKRSLLSSTLHCICVCPPRHPVFTISVRVETIVEHFLLTRLSIPWSQKPSVHDIGVFLRKEWDTSGRSNKRHLFITTFVIFMMNTTLVACPLPCRGQISPVFTARWQLPVVGCRRLRGRQTLGQTSIFVLSITSHIGTGSS